MVIIIHLQLILMQEKKLSNDILKIIKYLKLIVYLLGYLIIYMIKKILY